MTDNEVTGRSAHDVETCGPESIHFDNYCIDGTFYGYCGHPRCGGCCEPIGDCECKCHAVTS